jgi:drug/metabolite transporter (DMT)-like permease
VHPLPPHSKTLLAYGQLTLSMALVGVYVGLSPLLMAVFPVLLLACLRFAIGAVAMATWIRRGSAEPPLNTQQHCLLFLQSLLGNFLFTILALNGAWLAGATSAGVVMAALPACVALLSRVVLKEALAARIWGAAACSAMAVTLLALQKAGHSAEAPETAAWPATVLGHLMLLGAVACEASYVVIGKRLSASVPARRVTAIINLWGLVLSAPLGAYWAWSFDFGSVQAASWALLIFYALAASVFTVWLWMKGLEHVSAQRAGIFTVFLPLSSAAVGVGVLGEPWSAAHGAALLLAVAAIWLVTRAGLQPPARVPAGPSQTPRPPDGP